MNADSYTWQKREVEISIILWPSQSAGVIQVLVPFLLNCKMHVCVLQVGGVDPKQLAVYEEFARNVPGFLPSNDLSQPTGFLAQPMKVSFL